MIPLCAISLQDDINISILRGDKRLRSLVNEAKSTKSLQQQERFIEEVLDAMAVGWVLLGVGAWVRAKDKQDFGKFLTLFAFPFFCWSPIVIYFSTLVLLRSLSWQHTVFAWLTLIGFGTRLWLRGQKLEEQARNPLKGILERTEKLN